MKLLPDPPTSVALLAIALGATTTSTAQIQVDTGDRHAVSSFYSTWFAPSKRHVAPSWTGSLTNCGAGSIDPTYVAATIDRLNAYRALAGTVNVQHLPGPFTNPTEDEQAAALMLHRNNRMSVQSIPQWNTAGQPTPCWTRSGNDALFRSVQANSLGTDGIDAVLNGDLGDIAQASILQPTTLDVRLGSTDQVLVVNRAGYPTFPNRGTVSWPGRGFQPYQLVPDMWCFSGQDLPWDPGNYTRSADFSQATVTVTRNGQPLTLTPTPRPWRSWTWNGISWTFAPGQITRQAGMGDSTYRVTISNIGNANITSYSYDVTVFDPAPSQASFATFGSGCGGAAPVRTFYELFSPGTVDLAGTTWDILPDASGGYRIQACATSCWEPGFQTDLGLTDDSVASNLALGFSFPHLAGSTTTIEVSSNGYVYLQPGFGGSSNCCDGDVGRFVSQPSHVAVLGHDLNPSAGGAVHFGTFTNPQRAVVTWNDVPEYGSATDRVTMQLHLFPDGSMKLAYQQAATATHTAIVGYSEGNGTGSATSIDLTRPAGSPASLRATVGSLPVLGSTFRLQLAGYPSAALGALNVGVARTDQDLGIIGMPGCRLLVPGQLSIAQNMPSAPATFSLPIPNDPALAGLPLQLQGVAIAQGANPLGVVTTNGATATLGL